MLKAQAGEDMKSISCIISGLQESSNSDYMELMLDLVHSISSVPLLPADVESISRLGFVNKDRKGPRLLRVTLHQNRKSLNSDLVLKSSKILHSSADPALRGIYINFDKSREELKAEYNLRCEVRQRQSNGETDIKIRKGKVVKMPPQSQVNR